MRLSFLEHHAGAVVSIFLSLGLLLGTPGSPFLGQASSQELTPEMLKEASRRTGLSEEELLRRYRGQQGEAAATDTTAADQPGRTSLAGVDDSRPPARFQDTSATVSLPFAQALEQEMMRQALEDSLDLETSFEDSVRYFGADFFRLDEGVFLPPSFGPVASDYRLGVGDEIIVNVWGGIDFKVTRIVDRDGTIILPRAGKIVCAGRTLAEVDQAVREALARTNSSIDVDGPDGPAEGEAQMEISLGRLRPIRIFVVGAVRKPGSFELSSVSRVLTALYAAGGPTSAGSFRQVQLVRGGKVVATVDLYGYLLGGSRAGDAQLQEGDTVFVPDTGPRVRVQGEVKRPLYYEVKPGETLADLLGFCGGFTARAATEVVHIQRILPPARRRPVPFRGAGGSGKRSVMRRPWVASSVPT